MNNRKFEIFILIFGLTILLSSCNVNTPSKEWETFLDGLVEKYDFVDSYIVRSGNRRVVDVKFYLNNKKSVNEIKEVFEEVKEFLGERENVMSLNEYHKRQSFLNESGFWSIDIVFIYDDSTQEEGFGYVSFCSDEYRKVIEDINVEPRMIGFIEWEISVNYEDYMYDDEELDNLP